MKHEILSETPKIELYEGDCLEAMTKLLDKSIDMILCDLPYGTTACSWDTIIPFEPLWAQYKRIIKDNRAIVLTASQPFTSALVSNNYSMFKQELVWCKTKGSNPLLSKKRILQAHENILVFGNGTLIYNPQYRDGKKYKGRKTGGRTNNIVGLKNKTYSQKDSDGKYYPLSWNIFSREWRNQDIKHPTQKPVALFEYLIKTYTNENDLVLDNASGSGTTGVAAIRTNRNCILMEKEKKYCEIARQRVKQELAQQKLF